MTHDSGQSPWFACWHQYLHGRLGAQICTADFRILCGACTLWPKKRALDFCSLKSTHLISVKQQSSTPLHPSVAAKLNLCSGDASGQWQCCSPGLMQLADLEPHSELKNSSILLNKLPSFIFHFTFWYFFCDKVSTKFASSLALVHHLKLLRNERQVLCSFFPS